MKIKLLFVAGARPNFMKIAPMIREFQRRSDTFECALVHTGQHYDEQMSDVFFSELQIPKPDYSLNVGSASHAVQTAKIMTAFEPVCEQVQPDCVVVVGDVNSTVACALVAKKLNVDVAHVEAGLRSGDREMPEEINRIATDAISDLFYVTEQSGYDNLIREGQPGSRVRLVGHVMIDNLFFELDNIAQLDLHSAILRDTLGDATEYGVVTLHRPSNVDNPASLQSIIEALEELARDVPLLFPIHPRTRQRINEAGFKFGKNIHTMNPLGFRDFLALWKSAKFVITDSGGLQEETTAVGVPCITVRENTERPATVEMGTNQVVGTDKEKILQAATRIREGRLDTTRRPPLWDGKASERIADHMAEILGDKH